MPAASPSPAKPRGFALLRQRSMLAAIALSLVVVVGVTLFEFRSRNPANLEAMPAATAPVAEDVEEPSERFISYAEAPGEDVEFSEYKGVSAAEMRRIGELKVVRSLRMPINATDKDLRLVRGLRAWGLSVAYSQVHGPGLANLSEVEGLESLGLGWTKIDDDGLAYLPRLKNLRMLHLGGAPISEAGLKALCEKGFDSLEELSLEDTAIGDDAIRVVAARCKKLKHLDVYHTRVSDAALDDLAALPELRFLGCGLSRISKNGVQSLKARCPALRIDYGD